MSYGQTLIDVFNKSYKRPKSIKISLDTYRWLQLDNRFHIKELGGETFHDFDGIPVIIDKELKREYEFIF